MEKLEQAKSFDELRTGMIVVVEHCGGKMSRSMLLGGSPGGCMEGGPHFGLVPGLGCSRHSNGLCECSVRVGAVYRVVDEEPKQGERTRELELTR